MARILVVSPDIVQSKALVMGLNGQGCRVTIVRQVASESVIDYLEIDGQSSSNWGAGTFESIDVVVHVSDRQQVRVGLGGGGLGQFRASNLDSVMKIAESAASSGVKRFVYLSSSQVNDLDGGDGVSPQTEMTPDDYYAMSKREGEQALQTVSQITGMEVVIVRAAEVYGNRCDGWVAQIIKTLRTGAALPYAGVSNQLSLLHEDNLADALVTCALHPRAAEQIWTVDDGERVSTPELIDAIGKHLPNYAGLTKRPVWLLRFLAVLVNQKQQVGQFVDSSKSDSSAIRSVLEWKPPVNFEDGVRSAVEFQKNC